MSAPNPSRIDAGLKGLISTFFPDLDPDAPREDIEALQQHRQQLLNQLRPELQQRTRAFNKNPNDILRDVRDHIVHTGHGADAAGRFGNIYSRLMTLPIINNKAGILHLLHHLSLDDYEGDDDFDHGFGARSPQHLDPPQQPSQMDQGQEPSSPPERPRPGLAESPSIRASRQSHDMSAPRTPREAYSRGAAASRQESHGMSHNHHLASPEVGLADGGNGVVQVNKSPTEANLLRDLPFVLQGLSTGSLIFSDGETLTLPTELPLPIISILHTLAEPSLLYRNLHKFARAPRKGLVLQALQAAIETQLRAYLGLISTLEGEIRRCLAPELNGEVEPTNGASPDRPPSINFSRVGVTLKRCVIWTRDATLGLRLLSSLAEEADKKNLKGGSLISLVHRYADANGDPFVSGFAERMLSHLTRPFYDMLRQWIYEGELRDPYGEFFVHEVNPDSEEDGPADAKKIAAASVWDNKYKMNTSLIPTIVDEDFAGKVFLIGKSLNFIRYSCGDSGWVEQYSKEHSRELAYGDTAALESTIDIAYKTTMEYLISLLNDKFGLFMHLDALKRYLLGGQGDFFALLIESLASNLDKPAGTQYRHTLTAQLDHAIRGSNAQFDSPEVLRRLDARLLEMMQSEIGWDVFTLEYKVDAPCDVIVTKGASKQYLAVFNLLWRIKRLEYSLGGTWRRVSTGARTVLASTVGRSKTKSTSELGLDWKAARCTLSAMFHFINQLQYYVMVEVIEASWNHLQHEIRKEDVTLDGMIEAHTRYLGNITHRAMLGGAKNTMTGNRDDAFPIQLHRLLKAMISYTEVVDGLYTYSVGEFAKQQEAAVKADAKTRPGTWRQDENEDLDSPYPGDHRPVPGGWAINDMDSPLPPVPGLAGAGEDTILPSLRKRLLELSSEFKTRLEILLGDLLMQPDQELKFLGVAMNYNDAYRPVRRKRRRDREKERGTEKGKE